MVTGGHDGTCRVWMVLHSNMASALADTYVQTALGGTSGNGNISSNEDGFQCCHILWGVSQHIVMYVLVETYLNGRNIHSSRLTAILLENFV